MVRHPFIKLMWCESIHLCNEVQLKQFVSSGSVLASSPSRLDGLNAGRGAEVNRKRVEANVTGVLKVAAAQTCVYV